MLSHAHWYLKGFFLFPPHPLSSSFHFFKNDEKWILLLLLLFSFFAGFFLSFYLLLFLKYFELYMKWAIHLGWCMYIYSVFKTTKMRNSNIYLVCLSEALLYSVRPKRVNTEYTEYRSFGILTEPNLIVKEKIGSSMCLFLLYSYVTIF